MRSVIVILLLFSYMIPSIGVSLTAHYCGGKLASVSIFHHDGLKCPCGKMPMKNDCCKEKTTLIKLNDNQHKAQLLSISFFKEIQPTPFYLPGKISLNLGIDQRIFHNYLHPPDDNTEKPIYLLNEVFLI
ncbi:MAG: hypothetical protein ABJB16_15390 [Saprospiraceae bacterium]